MLENFLFLFTGILGLVTISLMAISYKSNFFYNFYLLAALAIMSCRFIIHGSFEFGIQTLINSDNGIESFFFLTVIPCFYLYYKNLVLQKNDYKINDLKHLVFILLLYILNATELTQVLFGFYFWPALNFTLVVSFIIFYLIRIFVLLKSHIWFKEKVLINKVHFTLLRNWTAYLFSLKFLVALGIIRSIYLDLSENNSISGKPHTSLFLIGWLFIYFKMLTSPEILYGLPVLNKKLLKLNTLITEETLVENEIHNNWILETSIEKKTQDQKLQESIKSNVTKYVAEVDRVCFFEHIFRDPEASHVNLAKSLGVPTSHIVYLFKYHSEISFSEYRMQCRIQDALNLISDSYLEINTLESLAFNIGFSSYNPFFNSFKKVVGCSPQEYLKEYGKQRNSTLAEA
jgi:AraC-like DNA-binding protein